MSTKIEWASHTWNPISGCTKVSEGCRNCYAERMSKRLAGRCGYPLVDPFRVTLHPDKLEEPLKWKKPRRIFVNSMSDLFHEDVPLEFIGHVFAKMHNYRQHTFMILTKRPERMMEFIGWYISEWLAGFESAWPREYTHVWLGVSVENQAAADERIPMLLQTPAAVRFISAEPLLGSVDLSRYLGGFCPPGCIKDLTCSKYCGHRKKEGLDWVIVGGESGPGARPMHPDWVQSLRDQCKASNVPYFFKQWGEWKAFYDRDKDDPDWANIPKEQNDIKRLNIKGGCGFYGDRVVYLKRVGKKKAGRELDGRTWDEMPGMGGNHA